MVFFALIFVTAPVLVISWGVEFIRSAFVWLPICAAVLLVIGIIGVICTKASLKKSLKGQSKEAVLLGRIMEYAYYKGVVNVEEGKEKCLKEAQKLGLPADEESLKMALRRGYDELVALQDAEVDKRFANDKIVLEYYYAKTKAEADRLIGLKPYAKLNAIENKMPGKHFARILIRRCLGTFDYYLREMILH